jgi:hypothetical protein
LKGGPSNALLNIVVPGLGHYFVSGDHYGNDRKPASLLITALYGGSLGGALYFKVKSDQLYDEYLKMSRYREYQRDSLGNITGVRGAIQGQAQGKLQSAQTAQQNSKILLGVGAGILVADLAYTLIKGLKNKAAWKSEFLSRTDFIFSSNGTQMTAGIRVKL